MEFDDVLAFRVPDGVAELRRRVEDIEAFLRNPDVVNTSVYVTMQPTLLTLQAWFNGFEANMMDLPPLTGLMRARVCYAERGMNALLDLLTQVREQKQLLATNLQECKGQLDAITLAEERRRTGPDPRADEATEQLKRKCDRMARIRALIDELVQRLLNCQAPGLTMMTNWLSTLVDMTPLATKSANSPLTAANMAKVEQWCNR